ncbi:MAG: Gfo/Idh/MocA family oxidoreductase [Verrucomicrobia bacterium]|nr:Gfo/Idh/MocA family oxidoreductase [Verrucomicrobiota bacterium]MCH8513752.1 Gfo/Idh/MocA family oxidoreductase [Kiritimatiellia bacterium]
MKENKSVRLGIIGLGNMGSSHAKNILQGKIPGLTLAAVCDQNSERLTAYEKEEGVTLFTDADSFFASGEVDAVLIATPHYDHTTLGVVALEKGLHVLVEKPISVHKADCERLIAAYKNEDQVFAAMFNQRTDPRYQKLRKLIQEGELGDLKRIQWTITDWFRTDFYYASGGWRATWAGEGGGVLLNQCPHQLDLWQWLFGMPDKVRAHCTLGKFHDIEVEDDVTAYLEYDNGCTGVFITTTGEAPGTNRLEVAGDRGRVVIEGESFAFTRNEVPTTEHCKTATAGFSRPEVWEVQIPTKGYGEQHVGILKNFAKAILDGEPLIAQAKEGIHSVELGNAMLYSGLNDQTVNLPLDAAAYESFLQEKIATSTYKKKVVETKADADDFSQSF